MLLDIEINEASALHPRGRVNGSDTEIQIHGQHGTAMLAEDGQTFRVRYYDPKKAPQLELFTDLAAPGRDYSPGNHELEWQEFLRCAMQQSIHVETTADLPSFDSLQQLYLFALNSCVCLACANRPLDRTHPAPASPSSFHFYDSVYIGVVDGVKPLVALEEARVVIELLRRCRESAGGAVQQRQRL